MDCEKRILKRGVVRGGVNGLGWANAYPGPAHLREGWAEALWAQACPFSQLGWAKSG